MEIRTRKYIDVHYKESDQRRANKIKKQLEKRGYILVDQDESGSNDYDYCDQYLGCERIKKLDE